MHKNFSIAVGKDRTLWHERFMTALQARRDAGTPVEYALVDLEKSDWMEALRPFDAVIWKPSYMGAKSASQFLAKVFFIETVLKKLVVPNYASIWHFENKIAQSYLFKAEGVRTPATTVSFDYHDAETLLKKEAYPLVFKAPYGAGSSTVRLVTSRTQAQDIITRIFAHQLWMESKRYFSSPPRAALSNILKPWLWWKLSQMLLKDEYFQAVYWQEFVPKNDADLRITVIGDRNAFAFWRRNRPHDFRASGSGMLDYQRPVPEQAVKYCMEINRKLNFDSMAYDILFTGDQFVVAEMSYAYLDNAIYNAAGYYELQGDDTLSFKKGHFWPQQLWVEQALDRANLLQKEKER